MTAEKTAEKHLERSTRKKRKNEIFSPSKSRDVADSGEEGESEGDVAMDGHHDEEAAADSSEDDIKFPERSGSLFETFEKEKKNRANGDSKLSLLGHKRKHGEEEQSEAESDSEHSVVDGVVVDEGDVMQSRGVVVVNGVVEKKRKDEGGTAEKKGKGGQTEKWVPPKQRDADLLFGKQRKSQRGRIRRMDKHKLLGRERRGKREGRTDVF